MLKFLFTLLTSIFLAFGFIFHPSPRPRPKPVPTQYATMTEAPTSAETMTEAPTGEGTVTEAPTSEGTVTETPTSEGTVTETPTSEGTVTETPTSEGTVTETPTSEGTVTETPTSEGTLTETPTGEVTETPTGEVTETPTAMAPSPTPGGFPFLFDNDPDDAVLQQIITLLRDYKLGYADMGNNHQIFNQILTIVENNMSSFDNDADDAFLVRLAELAQKEQGKKVKPTPEATPTLVVTPTPRADHDNDGDDRGGNSYPNPGRKFDNYPGPTLLPTLVMPPVLMPADPLPQQKQNFSNCKPAGGATSLFQNWFGGGRSSNGARSGGIVCAQR